MDEIRAYIKRSWTDLSRSVTDMKRAASDEKISQSERSPLLVYISRKEDPAEIARVLRQKLSTEELQLLSIKTLPAKIEEISEHGLLYLPHTYVVPGGRFNEMYGWDSYFIVLGLLRDGELILAKNMADNLLYEIEHYGAILNANRSYCLTRSQPPFITPMILALFEKTGDTKWLASTVPKVEKYYQYWTTAPYLNPETGLSRYFDFGWGPAPELVDSERDTSGKTYYEGVREYYRTHAVSAYDASQYYDPEGDRLTPLFYKGDRAMRSSGFDPSCRFGPFNADIIHYTPVCLNVLLYKMEEDIAQIKEILGYPSEEWHQRARVRHQLIDRFLWDEAAGLYLDYNFSTSSRRYYEFATTFYPLWAAIASAQQAKQVVENLPKFEAPGGLLTSTYETGYQWDAPFCWAPLQLIAVQGLHNYNYHVEADRLARKFISLVVKEFEISGKIFEKYDGVQCKSNLSDSIESGYSSNEVGFGWTNGVFLELLYHLNF